jgi:hypothetical protein
MKIDISKIGTLKAEELEYMHDETHVMFNKLLSGEKIEYTLRELHYYHEIIFNELIRCGGKHISPIDQLDKILMLEEDSKIKKKDKKEELKEEFILLEYFKKERGIKNLWALQIGKKIFEFESNPKTKDILSSIKKYVDAKGTILDRGEFKILEDNENSLSVEFMGENFNGIYNFKRNRENSDVWKLSKEGAIVEGLNENYGASLSNNEIKEIHFLSENRVGASEIANILSRPVRTVYTWIEKLK